MFDSQMFFPIIAKTLVEFSILFFCNFFRRSHPDWFVFVDQFEVRFLDLNGFLFFFFFSFSFFINFLDLRFTIFRFFLFFSRGFFFINFLIFFFSDPKRNRISNKFRMFFDQVFDTFFFKIFTLIFFKGKNNLCSTTKIITFIRSDCERSSSTGFPFVLAIIVMFSVNSNTVGNQVSTVKTDTKLTNHRWNISSSVNSFHERFSSRFCDGTKIVDQISFSHTDTSISDSQGICFCVWGNFNFKISGCTETFFVLKSFITNFIKSIRRVGDQFTKKNFFVTVESINDQTHQLINFCLESKGFRSRCIRHCSL
mmetsp:Transcript_8268/g.13101  ORF Transcript_8268/g.13101 Transcript_8268/m.13101 type:complete len:311 (+) Transcript_8268:417-1349(+)